MMRKVVVGLCWSASALSAEHVRAAEPAALSWSRLAGAASCPGLRDVAARVDQHLKRRAFVAPEEAKLFFEATIAQASVAGWQVSIALFGEGREVLGTRELELVQPECSDAVEATALALALMLDPDFAQRPPEGPLPPRSGEPVPAPVPARGEPPAAVAVPAEKPAPCPLPVPGERERATVRMSVGPWLAWGALPKPGIGVFGALRLSPPGERLGLELAAGYLGPRRAQTGDQAGGEFWVTLAGAGAWWAPWRQDRWAISLGAGARVGVIEAEAFGFTRSRYESVWLLSLTADVELSFALSHQVRLLVRPSLLVPTRREAFEARTDAGTTRIFVPGTIQAALTVGIAFVP